MTMLVRGYEWIVTYDDNQQGQGPKDTLSDSCAKTCSHHYRNLVIFYFNLEGQYTR